VTKLPVSSLSRPQPSSRPYPSAGSRSVSFSPFNSFSPNSTPYSDLHRDSFLNPNYRFPPFCGNDAAFLSSSPSLPSSPRLLIILAFPLLRTSTTFFCFKVSRCSVFTIILESIPFFLPLLFYYISSPPSSSILSAHFPPLTYEAQFNSQRSTRAVFTAVSPSF